MIVSKKAIEKAVKKRQKALQEMAEMPLELDPNFPKQNAFIEDKSRYIDVQCSRRAGKTNGLAIRFIRTMRKYPKSQCIYLALTRDSAREIMWPVLQEMNDRYRLNAEFVESKLTMTIPNGAKLVLMGADMQNFIKRLKGRKYPGVGIDEAQDFGPHLQSLIDDVLTPSISDYVDGWLAVTGTPGPVPQGYFFDVTQNRKYGYSHHEWTLLENPYMPEPGKFIEDLKKKREWDDTHPTLLREWRNRWVLDVDALWIRYKESLNHYTTLPENKKWTYILGIDVGYKDADALAVLAWAEDDGDGATYLVEELVTPKQGLTELVEQVQHMYKKYKISKSVIDEGGLGKKLAEEMRRRHGIPVQAADKARKQENVEIMNDHLRRAKFKAHKDSRFAQDSYLIQIDWTKSTPDKIVIKNNPHSDIIDAVLYAFKESPAWANPPELPPAPKWGTPEWATQESERLFEQALEHFEEQADLERYHKKLGFTD